MLHGKINNVYLTIPASAATITIASGKTFACSNTLTIEGTDASTLNIGTGGTLGTAAYTDSSAYEVSGAVSTHAALKTGIHGITIASTFATSGAFAITLTATGATNVTFPTSGTLATQGYVDDGIINGNIVAFGNDAEIQFNDGGVFGADSNFTWNKTTDTLNVNGAATFNNSQSNKNFRIKSNFINDMVFIDADAGYAGRTGLGTDNPAHFVDLVVPQPATAGVNAEGVRVLAGTGGDGDVSSNGGDGGIFLFEGGDGGAASTGPVNAEGGPGGSLNSRGGDGGWATSNSINNIGGAGAQALVLGGGGGVSGVFFGGVTDNTGGDGGVGKVQGGQGGGTTISSGTTIGGAGGDGSLIGGAGGTAQGTGTSTGGDGGNIILQSGVGGSGDTANGVAGEIQFTIGSTQVGLFERDGTFSVDTANYETLVTDDDDIPNKKYADDADTIAIKTISTKTANYTIVGTDYTILADATSNTVDISLPASPTQGQIFNIKCIDATFACTVARNGNDIDGVAADLTLVLDESVTVQYSSSYGWVRL